MVKGLILLSFTFFFFILFLISLVLINISTISYDQYKHYYKHTSRNLPEDMVHENYIRYITLVSQKIAISHHGPVKFRKNLWNMVLLDSYTWGNFCLSKNACSSSLPCSVFNVQYTVALGNSFLLWKKVNIFTRKH